VLDGGFAKARPQSQFGENVYGFSVSMSEGFASVVERVRKALNAEGFGVLTDIDVRKTLKEKARRRSQAVSHSRRLQSLLARRGLTADPGIGLLLPCKVIVREKQDKSVTVGFMDPVAVLRLTDDAANATLAREVRGKLECVRDHLVDG
jgi:uncharacterized protein (DUF302 family)